MNRRSSKEASEQHHGDDRSEDERDAEWLRGGAAQEAMTTVALADTVELTTEPAAESEDRSGRYAEQGIMNPTEAAALRYGLRPGRLAYLRARRELALANAARLPEAERHTKIAEINQRFPEL